MKTYNVIGYALVGTHLLVSALMAPESMGPWQGIAVGVAYLVMTWALGGLFISDMMHMGIAHRSLEYKPWFLKSVALLNSTVGVYVDPVGWINRHRLHHRYSDHAGDPNKLSSDGFWRTLGLAFSPYPVNAHLANDEVLKTWPFRLISQKLFGWIAPIISCGAVWLVVRDWPFAIALWISVRFFALWVNMIQNFWAHDRRFGTRRYDDPDNSVNITEWFPVVATFSACIQNNHHHYANLLRTSHSEDEFDFGYITVRWMAKIGLVRPTKTGLYKPDDVPLAQLAL
ncbi:MAG TPA: fatty acid desaturase [Steroidobacteraceae bacterium]|nr:fatty acid desaturase [Steroidobacteraceae bacterium]